MFLISPFFRRFSTFAAALALIAPTSKVRALAVVICAVTVWGHAVHAQNSGLPIPRFVSLNTDEVNMRTGPGVRYPVQWVYQRQFLPVEVIAEHDTWRKIRDVEGAEGWVHRAMLSGRRSVIVQSGELTLRQERNDASPAIARLAPGMVAMIDACDEAWCAVAVQGYEGWVDRAGIWGLYPNEAPK